MKTYQIQKATQPYQPGDADFWQPAVIAPLEFFPWFERGEQWHAQYRLLYTADTLYARMDTRDDRHIVAVHTALHAPVCRDSCAEFFLQPNTTPGGDYFNFEVNCIGNMLVGHGSGRHGRTHLAAAHAQLVQRYPTLPPQPKAEQPDDCCWSVEVVIPIAVMAAYTTVDAPAPGVTWRGNFYRCADDSTNPQWNCWNLIDLAKPDYHRPEFFGQLIFA